MWTATRFKALMRPVFLLKSLPLVVGVVAGCALTFTYNSGLRQGHQMVEHSMAALMAMDHAMSLLLDAETGQRGYVITGDTAYLAPYEKARSATMGALRDVDGLIGRNPDQHQALLSLAAMADRKLSELASIIDVRREQGLDAAVAAIAKNVGKNEMDDIRATIAGMKQREQAILADKQDQVDHKNSVIVYVSLAALLLSLIGRLLSTTIRVPTFQSAEDA